MGIELRQGEVVADRYRLDRLLGEGGMGVVWAAIHTLTDKRVALKFVKRAHESPDVRRRFMREARAASAVTHPNVREIHDIFEIEDGSPVMVMEYLLGESLAQRLERERKLPLQEAVRLLVQVVSAVGTAHALGIVHRDLKPDNVFITQGPKPSVKVLDFGIAKLSPTSGGRDETKLTHSGAMLGTPCYMSPEQVFGEKDIDHRVDVWALGLIAYRALSGILPTEADNVGQVMKIIVTKSIRPIEELVPDLPADLAAMINRMLSRSRKHRPDSLLEVQEVLERHTAERAPAFDAPTSKPSSGRDADPDVAASPLTDTAVDAADEDDGPAAHERTADVPQDSVRPMTTSSGTWGPRGLAAGAGLAALALASFALWGRGGGGSAPPVAPASSVLVSGPVTSGTPAPPPSAAPAAPAPELTTVAVAIEPRTATVYVDDVETSVVDGAVQVRGVPGSRHEVRVTSGKKAKTAEVVVTQDGAFPAKVSLGAEDPPRATGAAAAPKASGSARAPAPTAAPLGTAVPRPFQESEKFE